MTVSETYDISDKLWPFLESLNGLPPRRNWRFIFVMPRGNSSGSSVPYSAELMDLDLYSAEVNIGEKVIAKQGVVLLNSLLDSVFFVLISILKEFFRSIYALYLVS